MAIELPAGTVDRLFAVYADRDSTIDIDLDQTILTIRNADGGEPVPSPFPISTAPWSRPAAGSNTPLRSISGLVCI